MVTFMEIERKFLIHNIPFNLSDYSFHIIEQGYLNVDPVVRIRRQDNDYYLTYKSKGLLEREEYNLPLNQKAYEHMLTKIDGHLISKTRYLIPLNEHLTVDLDLFEGNFKGLVLAEVEFNSTKEAKAFIPPAWFGEDVTYSSKYQNSILSRQE